MSLLEDTDTSSESDALSSLEERIHRAAQLVTKLRRERDVAVQEASGARAEAERLADRVKALDAEKKQVRERIEKLLAQIDQLNNS